jgi:hypothetical protein
MRPLHIPPAATAAIRHADRAATWAGPPLLILLAFLYYGSYFLNGLNLGGEGGTTAVLAMRLIEGQRMTVDSFLGYNLLWFMPVVWLFGWTGPDYLAMKAFFFVLSGITALLGWVVVRRVSHSGLLALAVACTLVLIPGMIFRNYMGFLGVANQLALLSAFVLPARGPRTRMALIALSGMVLGLTFLVRVEVGLFMGVIWLGLLVLNPFWPGRPRAFVESLAGGALGACLLVVVHVPFAFDAHTRGYAPQFYSQYTDFIGLLRWEFQKQFARPAPAAAADDGGAAVMQAGGGAPAEVVVPAGRRPKAPLADVISGRKARDRFFAAALYLPVALAPLLAAGAGVAAVAALRRSDADLWRDALVVGVTVGCALTLFPQYFFFRPDTPHISEFMVPFLTALACALAVVVRRAARSPSVPRVALACGVAAAVGLQAWVHYGHAWPKESAGTAAARKHGPVEFRGQNNVRALLRPAHAEALQALHNAIVAHSDPADWVVCLPYSPTINFMTDRPSYLWDLYTDNTMAGPRFDEERIAELLKYQPAAVVIDHRAINNTEASRFPNWAPAFYAHLRANYDFAGEFLGNELFLSRRPPPAGEPAP